MKMKNNTQTFIIYSFDTVMKLTVLKPYIAYRQYKDALPLLTVRSRSFIIIVEGMIPSIPILKGGA